jgi:hypothetical protein
MDFSCDPIKCLECGKEFPYSNGYFVSHIRKEHNLTLRQYVVKWEYNNEENNIPKCSCGYCEEPVPFYRGNFLIGQKLRKHQNPDWLKKQYIQKYGIPLCDSCKKENDNFHRGIPRKNCEKCVEEGKINQGDKSPFNTSYKSTETMKKRYGVENPGQLEINRENSSKRMSKYNSEWKKNHTIRKYKDTELYYQSSFEYDFLELCVKWGIINRIQNGHSYNYLDEDRKFGIRLMTDFSIDNYEIEIKSSYIMKKQGGIESVFAKKKAVESIGKKYIFILDKDYSKFYSITKSDILFGPTCV